MRPSFECAFPGLLNRAPLKLSFPVGLMFTNEMGQVLFVEGRELVWAEAMVLVRTRAADSINTRTDMDLYPV